MNRKQRRAEERGSGKSGRPPSPAGEAHDPIALHSLGIDAFRAGRLEMAAKLIAQAIAANGQIPSFHYNLGIVLKARGELPEAAASYQRALALKPDYADAHNNLGNVWKSLGRADEARTSFERALALKPGNADAHYNLGLLCGDAGNREAAAHHFQRCLEQDPEDSRGIAMLLAHMGVTNVPERTSPAQLQRIYDVRSRFWDRENAYFGHVLVAEGLREGLGERAAHPDLDILDIGCGTGLVGAHVRPLAARLDGVDLSSAMLERARDKGVYDRLDQADLVSFMSEHANSYDAIVAAATLIHFGDLHALFRSAALCLRGDGLFVFTLFTHEADGTDFAVAATDRLAQNGCFRHNSFYVKRLAAESGFSVQSMKNVLHEYDQDGNPIAGILAVLRRIQIPSPLGGEEEKSLG